MSFSSTSLRESRTKGATRRLRNKELRQDELRNMLANQGHIQHVTEMISILMDRENTELSDLDIKRINYAMQGKFRLIDKYLPDLKSIEHTGDTQTDLAQLLQQAAQVSLQLQKIQENQQHIEASVVAEQSQDTATD